MTDKHFLIAFAVVLFAILGGFLVGLGSYYIAFGVIISLIAAIATFFNPTNGLIILVFSMMLSPKIVIYPMRGRAVTVSLDDLLLISIFLAYLTYHAIHFAARRFVRTPIDRPLIAMVLIYLISTVFGNLEGRLKPLPSFFFVTKYIQYFILFWLTANILDSYETLKKIIIAGTITAVIVSIYAYSLMPTVERVYPPFDHYEATMTGESATLGGYYLIVMSLALSFFMNHKKSKIRYLALGLFLFMMPPFVRTLSRASYYALAATIIALVIFSPKRKLALTFTMIAMITFSAIFTPDLFNAARKRLHETFWGSLATERVSIGPFTLNLEMSAALRVDSWKKAIFSWLPRSPIIGHGATGVGLVDAQIPRILGEFGLVGLTIFCWLIFSLLSNFHRIATTSEDEISTSISVGTFCALIGLLVQSIGVNTFIIIRIMTAFWFLTALTLRLPYLKASDEIKSA